MQTDGPSVLLAKLKQYFSNIWWKIWLCLCSVRVGSNKETNFVKSIAAKTLGGFQWRVKYMVTVLIP